MIGRVLPFRPDKADRHGQERLGPPRRPAAAPAGPGGGLDRAEDARFRSLMLPHLDRAHAYARFLCRDAALAEDLTQDAYLRAYRGFHGYRGGEPRAWLFAIVRAGFLSWARRPGGGAAGSAADLEDQPADADTPEAALVRRDDVAGLRAAVEALPEPFRETLVLRELEELSYRQVAEVTGVPIGTVMSRLARARRLLVAALREEER